MRKLKAAILIIYENNKSELWFFKSKKEFLYYIKDENILSFENFNPELFIV